VIVFRNRLADRALALAKATHLEPPSRDLQHD